MYKYVHMALADKNRGVPEYRHPTKNHLQYIHTYTHTYYIHKYVRTYVWTYCHIYMHAREGGGMIGIFVTTGTTGTGSRDVNSVGLSGACFNIRPERNVREDRFHIGNRW